MERKHWLALAVLFCAIFTIRAAFQSGPAGDFQNYYHGGRVVLEGQALDMYNYEVVTRWYRYLPPMAVIVAPLALLPLKTAWLVWTLLNTLWFLVIVTSTYHLLRRYPLPPWALALTLIFMIRFFVDNINLGQFNFWVSGSVAAGLALLDRKRDVSAGLAISLGGVVKVMPFFLGLYLVWKGRWRALAGLVGGTVFLLVVLPSTVLGPSTNFALLQEYIEKRTEVVDAPKEAAGQSFQAMSLRYLTETNAAHVKGKNPPLYVNFASLTRSQALVVAYVLNLLLVAFFLFHIPRTSQPYGFGRHSEYALCVFTMLMIFPEARRAQFLLLFLPVGVITYRLLLRCRTKREKIAAGLTVFAFALIALPSRSLVGRTVANWFAAHCSIGWGTLVLVAAVVVMRGGRDF